MVINKSFIGRCYGRFGLGVYLRSLLLMVRLKKVRALLGAAMVDLVWVFIGDK